MLPLHAAQCIAVHPSSSFLFRSFLADFFSTPMFPSLAAWCVANTVGVSDITRSQFDCSWSLQVLCCSQTSIGRKTDCNSSSSNRYCQNSTNRNYLWPNPLKLQWTIDKPAKIKFPSYLIYRIYRIMYPILIFNISGLMDWHDTPNQSCLQNNTMQILSNVVISVQYK